MKARACSVIVLGEFCSVVPSANLEAYETAVRLDRCGISYVILYIYP
jgi:hypothetical protein